MKVFGGNGNSSKKTKTSAKPAGAERYTAPRTQAPAQNGRSAPPPPPKKHVGRGILIALLVIVAIALAGILYWKITTRPPDIASPSLDPNSTVASAPPATAANRYYSVLVVGEDQLQANTDTIMVARYDTLEKTANVISIPRDTVVNVDWKVKKINTVFYQGGNGIESLLDEVEDIAGFRPNNYIVVKIDAFEKVIDALGGVRFDVPVDMDYGDYAMVNGKPYEFTINVNKGEQLLNGYDALGVFRFRQNNNGTGYAGGDIERLETQHALLKAIAQQAFQLKNVTKLYSIAQIVSENSKTDLSYGNLQWYAQEFLTMNMDNINFATMPTTGCWINGLTYVTINVDEWLTMVNEKLNPYEAPVTKEKVSILCQSAPEPTKHSLTPSLYFTTNGEKAYTNFYRNDK
ncbi:MAG: LCP family protein [Oscillospiraceae bacterium]